MLPREKFQRRGISVLSDVELIQIVVGSGIKGRDFKQISNRVIRKIRGGIREDNELKIGDLMEIGGIGEVTAMRILSGIELGKRVYGLFNSESLRIINSKDAYEIFKDMSNLKRERVDVICLNSRFEYICRESIALGSLNCANLSPREVLFTAVENNSALVIMAHNHPSGDSTPSKEDILLTKNISKGLELIGIQLLDHLIIGEDSWNSIEI